MVAAGDVAVAAVIVAVGTVVAVVAVVVAVVVVLTVLLLLMFRAAPRSAGQLRGPSAPLAHLFLSRPRHPKVRRKEKGQPRSGFRTRREAETDPWAGGEHRRQRGQGHRLERRLTRQPTTADETAAAAQRPHSQSRMGEYVSVATRPYSSPRDLTGALLSRRGRTR